MGTAAVMSAAEVLSVRAVDVGDVLSMSVDCMPAAVLSRLDPDVLAPWMLLQYSMLGLKSKSKVFRGCLRCKSELGPGDWGRCHSRSFTPGGVWTGGRGSTPSMMGWSVGELQQVHVVDAHDVC